jgi:hypothetical protein
MTIGGKSNSSFKPQKLIVRAPQGARAYPWILSKYFPSVRLSPCR